MLLSGCQPIQPFYMLDDHDLSHYVGTATELEEPNVDGSGLDEVMLAANPRTITNPGGNEVWKLTLEEAMSIALANSKVMRSLGARVTNVGAQTGPPERLTASAASDSPGLTTVYDNAILEASTAGVETALSAFDAQWSTSMLWEKNSNPRNNITSGGLGSFLSNTFEQDLGTFNTGVSKTTAYGTRVGLSNQTIYDQNNIPSREVPSDWLTRFDATITHPLLARGGLAFNRIAGPNSQPGVFNGVAIARIRTDINLANFEIGVRNTVNDVEFAYWNLYFAYRNLDANRKGRDSALATWRRIDALRRIGGTGGDLENWAQAKEQYYLFRGQMESALTNVYQAESTLRYQLGLTPTDERLIKPADEPILAPYKFDWQAISREALVRSPELRQRRWQVQRRELEFQASKNLLLPELNAIARYRWEGLGDDLIDDERSGATGLTGSNAFERLTDGDFQSWQLGFQYTHTLGFRAEKAAVRGQELQLLREKRLLEEQELEVVHQLTTAIQELQDKYVRSKTAFNRWVSASEQVEAAQAGFDLGRSSLDLLLDAQRRQADAEVAFAQLITDYNLAIRTVEFRRNTLLEYNHVYLAEGPWPAKAYFDAERRAHKRDASIYIDHGMTQPKVFSRGPSLQHGRGLGTLDQVPTEATLEEIAPEPAKTSSANRGMKTAQRPAPRSAGRATAPTRKSASTADGSQGEKFAWGDLQLESVADERIEQADYQTTAPPRQDEPVANPSAAAAHRSSANR
jgi:outer membrane protein TolC